MPEPIRPASLNIRGLILAILLLLPLFIPRIHPPDGRAWGVAWDAMHFPGFALITWTLAVLLRPLAKSDLAVIPAAAVIAFLIAGVSELSHDYLGRSTSWKDFGVDSLGIGFAVFVWINKKRLPKIGSLSR